MSSKEISLEKGQLMLEYFESRISYKFLEKTVNIHMLSSLPWGKFQSSSAI